MTTYSVQAILGDRFEDILVSAKNEADAINKAQKLTALKSRWTRFVV